MSATDWLEDSDPQPLANTMNMVSTAETLKTAPSGPGWLATVLLCALVFFAAQQIKPTPGPGPGPEPIPADGKHVLIVRDDATAGPNMSIIKSASIKTHANSLGYEYRSFDKSEDLVDVEPVYRKMAASAVPPPSISVLDDGQFVTKPFPDSIEAANALIK